MEGRSSGAVVLESIERWLAKFVERNDLAVDHGFIWKNGERFRNLGISHIEVIVVS
jgi:hypothetical protein